MGLEKKALPFEIKDLDEKAGTFKGIASTFQDEMGPGDGYGDVVRPGAYKRCISERRASGKPFKMLYIHDQFQPIGKYLPTEVEEKDWGLEVVGRFTEGVAKAQETRALMADGVIDGLSIGYYAKAWEIPKRESMAWRILTDIELEEISPVPWPADGGTYVEMVKSGGFLKLLEALDHFNMCIKAGKVFSKENEKALRDAHAKLSDLLAKVEKAPEAVEPEAPKGAPEESPDTPKASPVVTPNAPSPQDLAAKQIIAAAAELRMAGEIARLAFPTF